MKPQEVFRKEVYRPIHVPYEHMELRADREIYQEPLPRHNVVYEIGRRAMRRIRRTGK